MSRRRKPTQHDRILNALRRAGARGISQHDFNAGSVIDGGDTIDYIPRRINDLRRNFLIASGGKRGKYEVYVFEGVRSYDDGRPVVLRGSGGWARAYGCHGCAALCPRREYACHPYPVWVSPTAAMFACRRNVNQQEERHAA